MKELKTLKRQKAKALLTSDEQLFESIAFQNVEIENVNFNRRSFKNCQFKEVRFLKCDFKSASLEDCTFEDCLINTCVFVKAQFSDCTFTSNYFFTSSFIETAFIHCGFQKDNFYGTAIWDCTYENCKYKNLKLTGNAQPDILVRHDDLGTAAIFAYYFKDQENFSAVINKLRHRTLLLLGRFHEEGEKIRDILKAKSFDQGLKTIVFDFDRPQSLSFGEMIRFLAFHAEGVVVDLTEAKSVQAELVYILNSLAIPILPIHFPNRNPEESDSIYALFGDLLLRPWVLEPVILQSNQELEEKFEEHIYTPINMEFQRIQAIKNKIFEYKPVPPTKP